MSTEDNIAIEKQIERFEEHLARCAKAGIKCSEMRRANPTFFHDLQALVDRRDELRGEENKKGPGRTRNTRFFSRLGYH